MDTGYRIELQAGRMPGATEAMPFTDQIATRTGNAWVE